LQRRIDRKQEGEDHRRALYRAKSCDAGIAHCCENLARSYGRGDGVAKDLDKARALRQKACDREKSSCK